MPTRSKEDIVDKIRAIIEEISLGNVKAEAVRPNSEIIRDLGLDSLDYASAMLACEHWLGLKLREDGINWREITTVDQLAELFFEAQAH